MKYTAYPEYKPSGIAWLGDIPTHWEEKGLRYVCRFAYGDSLPAEIREDGEVAVYGSNGKVGRHVLSNTKAPVIVVGRKGSFGKVNYSTENIFAIDTTYFVDSSTTNHEISWLKYALLPLRLDEYSKDSAVPGLDREDAYERKLAVPPNAEQIGIASFLDSKTAQIDSLITKKRELIEKLKEKRIALISRTVTRGLPPDAAKVVGLDPNPKLKPSGIDWIGDVPEHWQLRRLKDVFPHLCSGVSVNSENYPTDHDLPGILKTSCVYGNNFIPEENKRVLEEELDRLACPVTSDSLIISRMNTPNLVGNCGYVDIDYPTLFLPDRLWIARFSKNLRLHGKYSWYLICSHGVSQQTGVLATGTSGSMKNLSQNDFLNIRVVVPPVHEQTLITTYLDKEISKLESAVVSIGNVVKRLYEYRASLITAAVTGKIDVRNFNPEGSGSSLEEADVLELPA